MGSGSIGDPGGPCAGGIGLATARCGAVAVVGCATRSGPAGADRRGAHAGRRRRRAAGVELVLAGRHGALRCDHGSPTCPRGARSVPPGPYRLLDHDDHLTRCPIRCRDLSDDVAHHRAAGRHGDRQLVVFDRPGRSSHDRGASRTTRPGRGTVGAGPFGPPGRPAPVASRGHERPSSPRSRRPSRWGWSFCPGRWSD